MGQGDAGLRSIRRIPKHRANQFTAAERLTLAIVATLGLSGVLGTAATAWWLVLR